MEIQLPFNLNFSYDDNLREIPDDIEEMRKGIEHLKHIFMANKDSKTAGQIGVYSRIVGELQEAKAYIRFAIQEHEENQHESGVISNEIRLAHVYQWNQEFEFADALFQRTIKRILDNSNYHRWLDFAYQHYGKCKYDQFAYREALELFNEALELRIAKADNELIESTRFCLERTRKMLQSMGEKYKLNNELGFEQ